MITEVKVRHKVVLDAVEHTGTSDVMTDPGIDDVILEIDVDLDVDMLVLADVRVGEERQVVESMIPRRSLKFTQKTSTQ